MKLRFRFVLPLLISGACAGLATAQAPAPKPTPAATKPAAKPAAKPATQPAANAAARRKQPAKPFTPVPPPLLDATEEQLAAAQRAYLGRYDCEFGQSIHIEPNPKPGYVDVRWLKENFTMIPVLSSTGALRLEDVTGRTLMIQIANKSMLMDTRIGRRLVDECVHPTQRAAIQAARVARAEAAAAAAASGIAPEPEAGGLGIAPTPARVAAPAATASTPPTPPIAAVAAAVAAAAAASAAVLTPATAASAPTTAPAASPAAAPASSAASAN